MNYHLNPTEGDVASFSQNWSKRQVMSPAPLNADTNALDFIYRDGRVTATVNGHEVFSSVPQPRNPYVSTNEFLAGLGAFNDSNSTVIRYRNLQIRRLAAR